MTIAMLDTMAELHRRFSQGIKSKAYLGQMVGHGSMAALSSPSCAVRLGQVKSSLHGFVEQCFLAFVRNAREIPPQQHGTMAHLLDEDIKVFHTYFLGKTVLRCCLHGDG